MIPNSGLKEDRWSAIDKDDKGWTTNTCHNPIDLSSMKAEAVQCLLQIWSAYTIIGPLHI